MSLRAALLLTVILGVIYAFPGLLAQSWTEFGIGLGVAGAALAGYAALELTGGR